jgi:hypothetical protein
LAPTPTSLRVTEQTNRRIHMTTSIDDELAEARGRIQQLRALEQASEGAERARIRRHLDVIHRQEASVLEAARYAPDEADKRLRRLRTRLYVAEHSVTADLSEDWSGYASAVEDELRRWDDYLERLQTSAATNAWKAREQAEAAIAAVRSRRIEVDERLAQARDASGASVEDARAHVTAARDELAQKADELSEKLT